MSMEGSESTRVRVCPRCGTERPLAEFSCEHVDAGSLCGWQLDGEPVVAAGASSAPVAAGPVTSEPVAAIPTCVNGHPLEPGDQMCLVCGTDRAEPQAGPAQYGGLEEEQSIFESLPVVDGWRAETALPPARAEQPWRSYEARKGEMRATLTLYEAGYEPDPSVHDLLRRTNIDHVAELLATGRFGEQAYEVTELITGGALTDRGFCGSDRARFDRIVNEIAKALKWFAEAGLRHRDIRPANVLVRTAEPLDLVITGFGSARLSDFDLEAVAPLELTRYSSPEAIVGAVSAASDWWSLGMILLEQATSSACFVGIVDKAFHLHIVARGVDIPRELDPAVRTLLRGLLARDPLVRWAADEVHAWLAGDMPEAPAEGGSAAPDGPPILLGGNRYHDPAAFALAACAAGAWEEARGLTLQGAVATWLAERKTSAVMIAEVRRVASDAGLSDDQRHALAMMALNPALPLAYRGDIITPAWLLANPIEAQTILSVVTPHLERTGREAWMVRLRVRAEAVREKAKLLGIELDEGRFQVASLASSRANLEAERDTLRQIFPDTEHAGLGSVLGKLRPTEEDLVILVSAAHHQFTALDTLIGATDALANRTGITLDAAATRSLLVLPRRDIFAAIDGRLENFARCGNQTIDQWGDAFRVERRMPLPRAAALLAVPREAWQEPPRQNYVANLIELFEKRVSGLVARGPLARFTIGKTTPRLDLNELGTGLRPAETVLNHILSRAEAPLPLDPGALAEDVGRAQRLRRLVAHADTFRRDTGIDGRYLAFPFLVHAPSGAKARVVPILLWPVVIGLETAAGGAASLMFDRDREEVRINPALEGLLGRDQFERLCKAREDILARGTLTAADVGDVFGSLAPLQQRTLSAVPGRDPMYGPGPSEIALAAALFNAEFTGQSVAEDLRALKRIPPTGTALEAAIRLSVAAADATRPANVRELDRYPTAASDPSQDEAVLRSRQLPGLVVEGPPGTGKSQTIVNIITDAIGRGETVLVVCQKQAALTVVQKRLDAEGLGERLVALVDGVRDREPLFRSLRDQLDNLQARPGNAASLRRQRADKAAALEELEAGLDRAHAALHARNADVGDCYRDLIGDLIAVEETGPAIDAPRLRRVLAVLNADSVVRLEEACAPVARSWLESAFEGSALSVLRQFTVDEAVEEDLAIDLDAFVALETARTALPTGTFEIDDAAPLESWLGASEQVLAAMDEDARAWLASTLPLFRSDGAAESAGTQLVTGLRKLSGKLQALAISDHAERISPAIALYAEPDLKRRVEDVNAAATPVSFLCGLLRGRFMLQRRVRTYLQELQEPSDPAALARLRRALVLEQALRPLRTEMASIEAQLGIEPAANPRDLKDLRHATQATLTTLESAGAAAAHILACPRSAEAETMARAASRDAYDTFRENAGRALARQAARSRSLSQLAQLTDRFTAAWINGCEGRVRSGAGTADFTSPVIRALPTLAAFQRFRARAATLEPLALEAFGVLRGYQDRIRPLPNVDLDGIVRRTLRREWLKAQKAAAEERRPELLLERDEIERRVTRLANLDDEMRRLNKNLLASDMQSNGTQAQWDAITRLRGPRAKRLREVFEDGAALGLMKLRPAWLMSPDVASRILPLAAGLFDLAIFDEASQMPVEYAAPALFRAKRVVIAGDEKQMPPTSFFGGRLEGDETDEVEDGFLENATDAEREAAEADWNRRDIQSCPDLLQLGRSFLPNTTLQIHYRSRYRELIGFSNAAYYRSALSVPARHPDDEVRRVRPIQVVRAEGLYEGQTNPIEATRVVDELAAIWAQPRSDRPSTGVVTFNRKQADLVEEAVSQRASADDAFRLALDEERARQQGGEDMGFFVKNLENVQGDERDVILFSTTFGRDKHGTFRRNFGVLGQAGGERRLNVAVTRAREKVVLVTSMPVRQISDWSDATRLPEKPRDYLQAYLDYASKVSSGELALARGLAQRLGAAARPIMRADRVGPDGFEQSVARFIEELGHQLVAAPSSDDAFGLDFAVINPVTGLFGIGIECDAPRHPLLEKARGREIWRRRVLQRAVPSIHRVSSREWYERNAEERTRLKQAIDAVIEKREAA